MVFTIDPCFPMGTENAYDEYQRQKNPEYVKQALQDAVHNMARGKKMSNDFAKEVVKAFRTYDITSKSDSIVKI